MPAQTAAARDASCSDTPPASRLSRGAQRKIAAAEGEIAAWVAALEGADAEVARLTTVVVHEARGAADKARRVAEADHLSAAAESLLSAYGAFSLGCTQVVEGKRVAFNYEPQAGPPPRRTRARLDARAAVLCGADPPADRQR